MKGVMNKVEEAGCKCTPKTYAFIVLVKKAATHFFVVQGRRPIFSLSTNATPLLCHKFGARQHPWPAEWKANQLGGTPRAEIRH
jgi:hypothetical protein